MGTKSLRSNKVQQLLLTQLFYGFMKHLFFSSQFYKDASKHSKWQAKWQIKKTTKQK